MKCADCPRRCRADRDHGEIGFCGGGKYVRVAKTVAPFDYEEPCLGTVSAIFFGGCALRCSYCQNHKISRGETGESYDDRRLAKLFDDAQYPIDLVTPSHFLAAIERAVDLCERKHAFIYNTSGYETCEAIDRAAKFTSVFLTDFKYADGDIAARYSLARDYPDIAAKALERMRVIKDVKTPDGRLERGLIVRHLVLPGCVKNSLAALDIIKSIAGTSVILSLMSQFTPNEVGEPSSRLRKIEYKIVVEHAIKLGFDTGYLQDFDSACASFIPEF